MPYGTYKQRREKHKYKQLKKAKHKREHEKHDDGAAPRRSTKRWTKRRLVAANGCKASFLTCTFISAGHAVAGT
jgi:hypothetical protein